MESSPQSSQPLPSLFLQAGSYFSSPAATEAAAAVASAAAATAAAPAFYGHQPPFSSFCHDAPASSSCPVGGSGGGPSLAPHQRGRHRTTTSTTTSMTTSTTTSTMTEATERRRGTNSLISDTERCRVCLEPAAKHIHYGSVTCFSCRQGTFLRSTLLSYFNVIIFRMSGPSSGEACRI